MLCSWLSFYYIVGICHLRRSTGGGGQDSTFFQSRERMSDESVHLWPK